MISELLLGRRSQHRQKVQKKREGEGRKGGEERGREKETVYGFLLGFCTLSRQFHGMVLLRSALHFTRIPHDYG